MILILNQKMVGNLGICYLNIVQVFLTHPQSQHIFSGPFEFAIRTSDKVVSAVITVAMKFTMTIAEMFKEGCYFSKDFQSI